MPAIDRSFSDCRYVHGGDFHFVASGVELEGSHDTGVDVQYFELQYKCQLFLGIFYCKCRDNGELPLKNDDFLLKNGRLFCNSRYPWETFPHREHDHTMYELNAVFFVYTCRRLIDLSLIAGTSVR